METELFASDVAQMSVVLKAILTMGISNCECIKYFALTSYQLLDRTQGPISKFKIVNKRFSESGLFSDSEIRV